MSASFNLTGNLKCCFFFTVAKFSASGLPTTLKLQSFCCTKARTRSPPTNQGSRVANFRPTTRGLREFRIISDRKSRLRLLPSLRDKSGKRAWADNFVALQTLTVYHDHLAVLQCDWEGGRIGFKPHPAAGCVTPGPSGSPLTASNCATENYISRCAAKCAWYV